MKTRHLLTLAAALFCGITFAEDKKPEVVHVDANGADKLVKEGKVVVLDVRTADEHKEARIAGSKNVDFTENDFEKKAGELDKSKSYLIHCGSGRRSTASLEVLQKLGFQHLYHLDGGLKAWQAAGKPVEKK